jgi:hypothetical protein
LLVTANNISPSTELEVLCVRRSPFTVSPFDGGTSRRISAGTRWKMPSPEYRSKPELTNYTKHQTLNGEPRTANVKRRTVNETATLREMY